MERVERDRARAYIDEARAVARDLSVARVGLELPRWTNLMAGAPKRIQARGQAI